MAQENISIIELDEIEAKAILGDTKFSSLKPVVCTKCENKINFERRLFQIKGVAEKLAGIAVGGNAACLKNEKAPAPIPKEARIPKPIIIRNAKKYIL